MSFDSTKSVEIEAYIDPAELDRAQQLQDAISKVLELSEGLLDGAIADGMAESSPFDEDTRALLLRIAINGEDFYGSLYESDKGPHVAFYGYNSVTTPADAPKLPYPEDVCLNRVSDPRVMIINGQAEQAFKYEEKIYSRAEEEETAKSIARRYGWRDGTEAADEYEPPDDFEVAMWELVQSTDTQRPDLRIVPPIVEN